MAEIEISKSEQAYRNLRIVVIGAGISGLSAAYRLTRPDFCPQLSTEILLLERSARSGGVISTYDLEDYTLELGPDMFLTEKLEAMKLVKDLGLEESLVSTNENARRTLLASEGQLHALPEGFSLIAPSQLKPFFYSSLLSTSGKFRMAMDMFIPKKQTDEDESVASFVRRRFGEEALKKIAQPMLAGIYTGDAEKLSAKATMTRFVELEQKYGSVIRGLKCEQSKSHGNGLASSSLAGARYGMFASFAKGMSTLVDALVNSLPMDCLHYQCPVVSVEKGVRGKPYDIVVADGTVVPADAVILSSPAYAVAGMLNAVDNDLAFELRKISYASTAVMNLIYNREDIPHDLDAFGFVIPACEKRTIMACSFASVKFLGRCPKEKAVLRIFAGGAMQPDVFDLTDEQIECLMWEDLHTYLGLKSVPLLSLITRYPRSMPQYNVGHSDLVTEIRKRLRNFPGLAVAGSAYDGVGIPDCISSGEKSAQSVVNDLLAIHKSGLSIEERAIQVIEDSKNQDLIQEESSELDNFEDMRVQSTM